jgi:hypothetical protein
VIAVIDPETPQAGQALSNKGVRPFSRLFARLARFVFHLLTEIP